MKSAARRIVCATDFSPDARSAGEVALAIALRLRATLVLVHVADQVHAFGEDRVVHDVIAQNPQPVLLVRPEKL